MSRLPKYVSRDLGPDGKERFYVRRKGQKKVRLTGVPWTPSFMAQYEAALGGKRVPGPLAPRRSGTFSWLCEQYFASGEFGELDDSLSKPIRRNTLLKICREPIAPNSTVLFGDVLLSNWNRKAIRALRDRVADRPGTSATWLKALRAVFKFAVDADHCDTNPTRDVAFLRSNNPDGHHSWTLEEVEKFESAHAIGTRARLAMGLLLYAAQRLSDVIRFGKNNVKVRDGVRWLVFTQHKNRRRHPVSLEIPIRPELWELITAAKREDAETFLVSDTGRSYVNGNGRGFSRDFADACIAANVPGRSHGLRKAAAARLAELGATEKEIQAITGHTTSREVARYTKGARQRVLAESAMARKAAV